MNLNVYHPGKESLEVVSAAIDEGETIYRSPHVGNINGDELNLIFGVCEMGGSMQLEMVDTIRGDDKYSNPRVAIIGERAVALASRNYAKSRIVGSCEVNFEDAELANSLGVTLDEESPGLTLKNLHISSLEQILPNNVRVTPSTEFFAEIGNQAYRLVLRETANTIDRPLRRVDSAGKIKEVDNEAADFTDIYGLGEKSEEGLLPPLEAMMAIEVLKTILSGNGNDGQIVHVAGADMVKYTQLEEVMQPVETISKRALSDLGIPGNVQIDYVVPYRGTMLASDNFDLHLPASVRSQYDLLSSVDQGSHPANFYNLGQSEH